MSAPINAYLNRAVPFLGRRLGKDAGAYSYLPRSMGRFLSLDEFCRALVEAGFDPDIRTRRQTLGVAHLVVARKL